jgi:hypothetical protein
LPVRSLAALAALTALLLLAPQPARAHGGHDHPAAKQDEGGPAASASLAVQAPVQAAGVAQASTPCPDTPGHVCGCGNLVACPSGNPPGVIDGPASVLRVLADSSGVAFAFRDAQPRAVPFPSARPRAPPHSAG